MLSIDEMRRNYESGLELAKKYFMGTSDVQHAAGQIASTLADMGIPYAICGALAVTAHGHVRLTEDVGILLTADGLRAFKEQWLGRGWVEKFPGAKGVRDTRSNVRINVLITGEYPGDGKPKPVQFPDPDEVSVDLGGVATLQLPTLIGLKIASALTAPDRPRDFDDVIQLVRANALPEDFRAQLNPYVQDKYAELWGYAQIRRNDG